MSKAQEIPLNEIRIHSHFLHDALSAVLHTVLFVRAPNIVKATDQVCDVLHPLTFAKCGPLDVDQTISETIEIFKKSLFQIGPGRHFRGEIVLSFYESREIKEYLGLYTRTENFYFERWKICFVLLDVTGNSSSNNTHVRRNSTGSTNARDLSVAVNNYSFGNINDLSEMEGNNLYYSAYDQVQRAMTSIIEAVNASSDHIPLSMYDYEVQVITPPASTAPYSSPIHSNANTPTHQQGAMEGNRGRTSSASSGVGVKISNSHGMFNAVR